MSASNSAEKNLFENNLPKRVIGLDRFNLSDEDLHNIRIHVAVFKYNNPKNNTSGVRTMNDKRNQLLPFKRKLLKNSMKNKARDDNLEEAPSLKRSCNRYQGVGNFPTVHLNKTPVISRPIKKHVSNEVKIQYPEVPMNRFITHVPDFNLDLKSSSTRSVLDVLQDLSRKRIHSKDDLDGNSKLKLKGLGGDRPLDIEAPYKPLFVQKSKTSTILTKDSTTQTQEATPSPEPPSSSVSSNVSTPTSSDPRAELRRKLAKQNNEIFASLSSSIFSPFSIKRKLRNPQTSTENGAEEDDPSKKRPRLATKDLNLKILYDGGPKSNTNRGKASSLDKPNKTFEKRKSLETSPKVSPGRDRLMSIYFDMQNGNPKADIFRNNTPDENGETDKNQSALGSPKKTVSFNEEVTVLTFNNKDDNSEPSKDDDKSLNTSVVSSSLGSVGPETKKTDPPTFNFGSPASKTSKSEASISSPSSTVSSTTGFSPNAPTFNFTSSPGSSFKIPLTSTVSSPLAQSPIFSTGKPSDQEKTVTPEKQSFTAFNFGSSEKQAGEGSSAGFGTFKFSSPNNNHAGTTASPSQTKETPSGDVSSTPCTAPLSFTGFNSNTTAVGASGTQAETRLPQFGSSTNNDTVPTTKPPEFTFGRQAPVSTVTTASENKIPTFSFGQTQPTPKTSVENVSESQQKANTAPQTPIFSFGLKPPENKDSPANPNQGPVFGQNNNALTTSSSAVSATATAAAASTTAPFRFGQNPSGSAFTFGQKATEPIGSSAKANLFGAPKPESNFPFAFGQTRPSSQETTVENQAPVGEANAFGSKTNLFSFGKNPQENTNRPAPAFGKIDGHESTGFGQTPTAPSTGFGQTATTQAVRFDDGSRQTVTAPSTGFGGQNSTVQPTGFGQASTTLSTGFGGQNQTTGFGLTATTTQSVGFGQNSVRPQFGQTTQSTGFGQKTTTTTTTLPFGQTTNAAASAPPFGQSSSPVPAFGQPAVTQTAAPFGQNQTTATAFGSDNKSGAFTFGQSRIAQIPPVGQNAPLFNGGGVKAPETTAGASPFRPDPLFPAYGTSQSAAASTAAVKPTPAFGVQSSSGFFNQPATTQAQTPLFGGQQTSAAFGSSNAAFGQNSNSSAPPAFGQNSTRTFGQQNSQLSFGSSSTASSSATPSGSNAPVFGFNASASGTVGAPSSNFSFGAANPTPAPASQAPFAFGSQTVEPFKFGAGSVAGSNQNKETPNFNTGTTASPFAFGSQAAAANNNNNNNDPKPGNSVFSFGTNNNAPSSESGFNFGSNVRTPVFGFGNSGSSGSSTGSAFSFGGTPEPNQNPFGGNPAQPPSPFPIPGTFSIGSGSSQSSSRPRGNPRLRRRP